MSSYPICKSCSFLAINFYEEISNTFEDCLSEALIPENTFLLSENNSAVLTVDKSYRCPFKNVSFDEAFITCEANKIEESVKEITQNAMVLTNEFKWDSSSEYVNSCKDFNKEILSQEKDLSIFREKVLHGKFQYLDVPQIPFPLLKCRKQQSFLGKLLKHLPMMDLEDPFSFDDTSFEDNDTFFNVESKVGINSFYKNDDQRNFEKLVLPELNNAEFSNYEEIFANYLHDTKIKSISEHPEGRDNISKPPRSLLLQVDDGAFQSSSETHDNCRSICMSDNNIPKERCPEHDSQLQWNIKETQFDKFTVCTDISMENCADIGPVVENNAKNEACVKAGTLLNKIFSQSQNLNQSLSQQNFSSGIDCGKTLILDDFGGKLDFKNADDNLENIFEILKDPSNLCRAESESEELHFHNKVFNELKHQENSCIIPIEEFTHFEFHQNPTVQEDEIKSQETSVLDSHVAASYKEKLSNLQYQTNMNMKNSLQSVVTERKAPLANDLKHYTSFGKQTSLFESANRNVQEKVNKVSSQKLNPSQPVDLLSNFIQGQFFRNSSIEFDKGSSKSLLKSPFHSELHSSSVVSRLQVKESEFYEKNKYKSTSKHFQEESIPLLVQLEVEDLVVALPEEYIKILLCLEDASIPLLQSLMLTEQFKFPTNLTLADIPPYKTCFLLNQEVKRCQDKQINKGNMGDYYKCLLTLHGILKTMECVIHFDVHLALSSLHEYDRTHKCLIKRFYEKLIEKFEHDIDECFENNFVHPKVKELSKYLRQKNAFCKENHLKFKR